MEGRRHSDGAKAMVERLRRSITERDLEALTSCFAVDYVNETPVHPSRGFKGRDQVRRNWEQILSGVPDVTAQVLRCTTEGDTAWSEWKLSGTRRDGSAFEMRGVGIFGVVDGEAAWCRFYLEPVDRGGEDINAATRRRVTGSSGVPVERNTAT